VKPDDIKKLMELPADTSAEIERQQQYRIGKQL